MKNITKLLLLFVTAIAFFPFEFILKVLWHLVMTCIITILYLSYQYDIIKRTDFEELTTFGNIFNLDQYPLTETLMNKSQQW